jgi:two-component system, cell cycle sensor histidine kinase and response regulator CckA
VREDTRAALNVAVLYLVFAALWILLSDQALSLLVEEPARLTGLQTAKGLVFVAVTAAGLFAIARRSLRAHGRADEAEKARLRLAESEERLAAATARLRHVLAASPTITYTLDLSGDSATRTWVSDNVERLFGYSVQEALRTGWWRSNVHPSDRDAVLETHRQLLEAGELRQEYRFRHRDGSYRWVRNEMRRATTADGRPEAVGTWTDITQNRRAEEALRQEQLRALLESASDVIVVVGREERVLYASPSVESVLGLLPGDLVGRPASGLVHPEDLSEFRGFCRRAKEDPGAGGFAELRFCRRDGSVRVLSVVAKNQAHDPAVGGLVLNCRDVTERRELEEQYRQSQKMEAIGLLAGGVAHDFNNALTAIKGYAHLMLAEMGTHGGKQRDDLEEICRAAERAEALTRQLLAFSRKQVLAPTLLDPNALVRDISKMLRLLLGEHNKLEEDLTIEPCRVRADRGSIEQVLMNLVVNARDAMPEGGRLRIETRSLELDAAACARLALDIPPGRYVRLTVRDSGVGIDPDLRERIFEPFFTTKEPGRGTGLGLSTVFGVVKQTDGHIRVESEPGQGAAFEIYLPQVDSGEPRRRRGPEARDREPRGDSAAEALRAGEPGHQA